MIWHRCLIPCCIIMIRIKAANICSTRNLENIINQSYNTQPTSSVWVGIN